MKRQVMRVAKCAFWTVGVASILWSASQTLAQPPGGQGRQPGGPGGPPGGPQQFGQPFGGPGRSPGFGGGFGMMGLGGPTALLRREDVRKELELLDDQEKQLDALEQKMRDRMREAFTPPRDRPQEGNRDQKPQPSQGGPRQDFRQMFEKFNKETRDELAKILLPHQLKRLDQLNAQLRMQGGPRAILGGDVARDLGITDQQREDLQKKIEAIEQETRKKEAEIRRQAREQAISLLTPEQQKKYREMVGAPFEFQFQMPSFQPLGQPGRGGPSAPGRASGRPN